MKKNQIYFLYFVLVITGCNSTHTAEQKVTADTAVTIPIQSPADSTVSPRQLTVDDTIRVIKRAYVLWGHGVSVLDEMDDNSGHGAILPFASPMDVIGEYSEWYEVRADYGFGSHVFYVRKEATVAESPIAMHLFYPSFELQLKGFATSAYYFNPDMDTTKAFFYGYNPEGYNGPPAFTVKLDTLNLEETYHSVAFPNRIRIVPKNKGERFIVSYAYLQQSYETIDRKSTHLTSEQWQTYRWQHLTEMIPYTTIADSAGYFNLPEDFTSSSAAARSKGYYQAFKQKFKLRDTSVTISDEGDYGPYETHVCFTRNRKLFQYSVGGNLYVRIERYAGGKLKETRCLILSHEEGC